MKMVLGYKRADGRIGIRNYILVVSMVQCSNSVALRIAQRAEAIPITHEQGCVEFAEDHNRTELALIAAGKNPNVYGVLLVGLGCEQTNSVNIENKIAAIGKPVERIIIQEEGGSPETVEKGIKIVKKMQEEASKQKRVEYSIKDLVVGVQCGGSDWTTALAGNSVIGEMTDIIVKNGGSVLMSEVAGFPGSEHIIAQRAVSKKIGFDVLNMIGELRQEFTDKYGQTIEEVNPTPGNKDGGITTLVEKSMGNIKKMGTSPVQGVIKVGQSIPYPGLWILDCRAQGPDSFTTTGFAMAGAHVTVFSTGRGTPLGSAVMPLLKVTGNPLTYKSLNSIMDFNAGTVIEGKSIKETGNDLYECLLQVASGKLTKSEINGDFPFTIPRERARKVI
ncbi:UxaA family hydrolase [Clostridium magnum]|uniref:Altronate dehydratase n=1 Tax=Clostridium magnum DSM 2767 TaxID=1121326 RepID=A0A162RFP1_9CLOT|nr:UxaA family hydrolase [Clostridium magnum]KZL89833.1 altronate dehydratase [Clostridium magnum DSM 2767]SHI69977.1 altronate dehydratase large subunit [Clostridium magnum DSM 2767]